MTYTWKKYRSVRMAMYVFFMTTVLACSKEEDTKPSQPNYYMNIEVNGSEYVLTDDFPFNGSGMFSGTMSLDKAADFKSVEIALFYFDLNVETDLVDQEIYFEIADPFPKVNIYYSDFGPGVSDTYYAIPSNENDLNITEVKFHKRAKDPDFPDLGTYWIYNVRGNFDVAFVSGFDTVDVKAEFFMPMAEYVP